MKIELETPYRELYRFGYLVTNKENRKHVILYNSKTDRTTVSYARYLMTVKLGHFISDDLHVDHIDNDKTNDSIDNLQVLTVKENAQKQGLISRKWKHGTLSGYRYCKCELCTACSREYHKNYKKQSFDSGFESHTAYQTTGEI